MEDLQLEEKLDLVSLGATSHFKVSFIEPGYLTIDNKLQFEVLFDLQSSPTFEIVY